MRAESDRVIRPDLAASTATSSLREQPSAPTSASNVPIDRWTAGRVADERNGIGEEFALVLAAAKSGHGYAIERLYRSCAPLVRGYLRSNRVHDADDVTSDVFVSMLTALPTFEGDERSFRSWLLTITHRRMVDAVRRHQRRPEDPADPAAGPERAIDLDGEQRALDRLESRGLLDAIDELTPDQRATLMLRVLADLSVPEIARVLQKPESAVKALLRRGFASLRRTRAVSDHPAEGS
jgi:RNA polymerase sigma factor (sigma-70 family)